MPTVSKTDDDLLTAPPDLELSSEEPRDPVASWDASAAQFKQPVGDAPQSGPETLVKQTVATIAEVLNANPRGASDLPDGPRLAERDLEDRAPFGMTNLRVCRGVLGFGSFEPIEPSGLKAGQPIILYCELTGLHYLDGGPVYVSRLSSRIELIDSQSGETTWEQSLGETEDECRTRRRDNFINFRMNLPATVKPGAYRLRLTQTDLAADQTAAAELAVTIVP